MTGRTVLVVEDEDDIRLLLELSLRRGGWIVFTASSGEQGLELAPKVGPDVVLLDVMMPGVDGLEVLDRLREIPQTADTPVVFLTACAQRHEVARLEALGAAGVIPKPFHPMTLPDQLLRTLQGETEAVSATD